MSNSTSALPTGSRTRTTNGAGTHDRIDTIRDLLFGEQTEYFEARIQTLENELNRALGESKRELTDRISAMEESMKQGLKELRSQVVDETKNRQRVNGEILQSSREIDKKHDTATAKLEKSIGKSIARLDELLEETNATLSTDFRTRLDEARKAADAGLKAISKALESSETQLARKIDALDSRTVSPDTVARALADAASKLAPNPKAKTKAKAPARKAAARK